MADLLALDMTALMALMMVIMRRHPDRPMTLAVGPVSCLQLVAIRSSSCGPGIVHEFTPARSKAVVTNEAEEEEVEDVTQLDRDEQSLKSPDLLAIKGLAQFKRFPAVVAPGNLIERWHVSDFHITRVRPEQEAGYAEHLSGEGENLSLVVELAEEFRSYADHGGQVFVSTHSPDFLNAAELDEVFWLHKVGGYTKTRRASDDSQVAAYMKEGDQMGYLWKQGFFEGANPGE